MRGIPREKMIAKTINGNTFVIKPTVKLSSREGSLEMVKIILRDKPDFIVCFACGKEGHIVKYCHTHKRSLLRDPVQSGGLLTHSQAKLLPNVLTKGRITKPRKPITRYRKKAIVKDSSTKWKSHTLEKDKKSPK